MSVCHSLLANALTQLRFLVALHQLTKHELSEVLQWCSGDHLKFPVGSFNLVQPFFYVAHQAEKLG